MDSTTRPELPQPLRAPNIVSNQAMGRLCGLLTSDLEEPASASIPALLGRYRIIRPLAEGASGKVYEAEDLQLGRRVAMKVLGADADGMVKRFFREASVAAKLRHPNLITIHEVSMARRGDGSPVHFIVMDLHPRTLEAVLEKNELTRDERLRLLEQVARAVHHAHENGVVHRDLKPANILIDERGHPVVSDFGLAREESQATLTRSGVPVGTPSYMSPEQVAGRAAIIGPRSDVYALGVILYRMLTNRLPFDGASVAEVYSSILAEDPKPPEADRDLQTICLKAMDRERDRRYASALDVAEDLRRFLAGEPILARPDRTIRRLRRLARGPAVWVAAAGAALVGAVGFWAWKVAHREQAMIDRESAGDRVRQIDGAYTALHQGRAEALRYLEDAFHGGNDGRQCAAMVERIESLVREMSISRPLTGLPASWLGLARVFAGDAGGWRDLDAAVDRAGDDPFPLLLRARVHLAVYSREAQLAATIHRDGVRRVLALGTLVETAEMRDRLALAAGDVARASASPLWSELPAATDYRGYAEGASLLSRGDHQKAAMRLEAIRDHAVLGSEAECLRGICFALVRDSAAAAECWERLTPRGWPMVLLAAARARLDAGRAGDDLRHYEHAARNAGNVRVDGDLAKFALLACGHAWQLIGRRQKQSGEDPSQAFGRATDAFAKAVALDEMFGPAWCELAEVGDSLGDEKGALHNARTAVRVEPRHGRAWQVLAAVAQAAAKRRGYGTPEGAELLAEAVDAGTRAADAEPDNADFRFTAGHVCWQAARPADNPELHLRQAIAHFDAAVRARKGFGNAIGERGHAWLELAELQSRRHADPRAAFEKAIADYAEAMALGTEPDLCRRYRGVAHRSLAEYLYEAGKDGGPHLDQAERDHTEGIRANPRDAESYRLRAFVHRGRAYAPGASLTDNVRKGLADLADAIRIDPNLIQAYADKAEAHAAIDEFTEALACVDAGLKRAPRHAGLLDLQKRLREFIQKRGEDE